MIECRLGFIVVLYRRCVDCMVFDRCCTGLTDLYLVAEVERRCFVSVAQALILGFTGAGLRSFR